MYSVFRSLVLSEIAIKDIDIYGATVVLNKRLSQEFMRKSLAKCFVYVKIHYGDGLWKGILFDHNDTSYWLGYLLHSNNDQPAVVRLDGEQIWYKYGKRHRDNDKHAHIDRNGTKKWYQHGELHRDNDQPAVIYSGGYRAWY